MELKNSFSDKRRWYGKEKDISCLRPVNNPDSLNTAIHLRKRVMSQPQPAPYYPTPKKSSTGIIIAVVIVVVVLIAGLGGYGVYQSYRASVQPNYGGSTTTISCQSCVETVPVTGNSTIEVSAQSAVLTLNLGTRVTIGLHVDGQSCSITINGGYTRLMISGQSNVIYAKNTVLLSTVDSGQGNVVHQ